MQKKKKKKMLLIVPKAIQFQHLQWAPMDLMQHILVMQQQLLYTCFNINKKNIDHPTIAAYRLYGTAAVQLLWIGYIKTMLL